MGDDRLTIDDRELHIIKIKAELFDMQNEYGQLRIKMDKKVKELNQLIQERNNL